MALGDAWTLHQRDARRRRVAIGDGRRLDCAYPELRHGLDFIANADDLRRDPSLPWVISHRGLRPYHDYEAMRRIYRQRHPLRARLLPPRTQALVQRLGHYCFRSDYRPTPAPIVLTEAEAVIHAQWAGRRFAVIEPHIKAGASPGKQWAFDRYQSVARRLNEQIPVYQLGAPDSRSLEGIPRLPTRGFRDAFPYLKAAQFYIGGEGGLHHAAAAMGTRAVVLYGGYTAPQVTGYDFHIALTGGAAYACGVHYGDCPHCRQAMEAISVDEVLTHAQHLLRS